ncbi:MAG: hypothetical protein IPJ88_05825 [Myxococcales bacterium]|nr:MAG: hypothetical protein IPJ88_05825 [Myxococcales bacterium]
MTYRGQVAEVLDTYCSRCHYDGGQGTGNFTDYETAKAFATVMLGKIEAHKMPPPVSDPECRDYLDSERLRISDEAKGILAQWIEDGLLEGDPSLPGPQGDATATSLTDANLNLTLPEAYTPSFSDPDNPGNEYRCFVIDHQRNENFYITAMHPTVDQPSIVHHIVLFKVAPEDIPEGGESAQGFDCIDMAFFGGAEAVTGLITGQGAGSGMLAGWAPGTQPVLLSEGYGLLVKPEEKFILQMHYFQRDPQKTVTDHSGYQFRIQNEVDKEVIMLPFGPTQFTIPANDSAYTVDYELPIQLPIALKVHGVFPHMHYLGSGYHMRFEHNGNEECLVRSDGYDFDNQRLYMFKEPVDVPAGSKTTMGCTWNNSESNPDLLVYPPQDIGYGERTDEEMCFGFTLISLL